MNQIADTVPSTDSLNQLWMITMQARDTPASNTLDIWYKVRATFSLVVVDDVLEPVRL